MLSCFTTEIALLQLLCNKSVATTHPYSVTELDFSLLLERSWFPPFTSFASTKKAYRIGILGVCDISATVTFHVQVLGFFTSVFFVCYVSFNMTFDLDWMDRCSKEMEKQILNEVTGKRQTCTTRCLLKTKIHHLHTHRVLLRYEHLRVINRRLLLNATRI